MIVVCMLLKTHISSLNSSSQPLYPTAPQVQAAIKRKLEKQKKRTNGNVGGASEAQTGTPQTSFHQKSSMASAVSDEENENLEETQEEMMERQQKKEGEEKEEVEEEKEEVDSAELLPIVDSMFGQVGATCSVLDS